MEKYTDYNDFAYVYNRFWGDFPISILPILEELVLKDFPKNTRILDLCCGTGQLAAYLVKEGYEVTGIDSSEDMLRYARQNAPTVPFIPSDVRSFMLMARFNIAFATFDSLNHLMSLEDLEQVFGHVYRQLETNGVFVFDMNLESGFLSRWSSPFHIIEDDVTVIVDSSYNVEAKIATAQITAFTQADDTETWKRADVTLTQRAYTIQEIFETLAGVGFIGLEVFDSNEDFKREEVGRAFFRARKR